MCDYDRERKSVHGYMVLANQSVLFQCFSLAMLKLFTSFSKLRWVSNCLLLHSRLERVIHDEVRVLRLPHRSRRSVGRGLEQQLPQSVLQLHCKFIKLFYTFLAKFWNRTVFNRAVLEPLINRQVDVLDLNYGIRRIRWPLCHLLFVRLV